MKIQIKSLSITNFKGISSLKIDFSEGVTTLSGANATGKTTVFDAYTWLLFGKDSTGRSDFEIKTLDENNNPIHELTHEVEGMFVVNGSTLSLRRAYAEEWVTTRGETTKKLKGHKTEFFINDVPKQAGEYKSYVDSLISDKLFKLVSDPLYFNSLKWQERRSILTHLAGVISDADIAGDNADFVDLIGRLGNKKMDEYKAEIAAAKKKIKPELEAVPVRIDEAKRSMPEKLDFDAIEKDISALTGSLKSVEAAIEDKSLAVKAQVEKGAELQGRITEIYLELCAIERTVRAENQNFAQNREAMERDLTNAAYQHGKNISLAKDRLWHIEQNKSLGVGKMLECDERLNELKQEWGELNAQEIEFPDDVYSCPMCGSTLKEEDTEAKMTEIIEKFNRNKLKKFEVMKVEIEKLRKSKAEYNAKMAEVNRMIEATNKEIDDLKQASAAANKTLEEFKATYKEPDAAASLLCNEKHIALSAAMEQLKTEYAAIDTTVNTDELKAEKQAIFSKIDALKKRLAAKDVIDSLNARITELQARERVLLQEYADLEKKEFIIQGFTKAKMAAVTERVNGMFTIARFKMYETQLNGGEAECCETLAGGVPFADANNAMKINVGLDIINTISRTNNEFAPIFVDNAEAVNELLPVETQIIRLVVTKDKTIVVK